MKKRELAILMVSCLACFSRENLFGWWWEKKPVSESQEQKKSEEQCKEEEQDKSKIELFQGQQTKKETGCIVFNQGDEPLPEATKSYTAPGNYNLNGNWDVFLTGSYLYWNVNEEGLDLASSAALSNGTVFPSQNSVLLFQGRHSSSGFKVGFGTNINKDESQISFEYTWFRSNQETAKPAPLSDQGQGIWFINSWFLQPTPTTQQSFAASNVDSKWKLSIDWADGFLSRASYLGRSFIITPYGGLRSSWIRQRLNVAVTVLNATPAVQPVVSRNTSHSWGIGPRGGFTLTWLLGSGFKLFGDLAADILYTEYSTRHSEDAIQTTNGFFPLSLTVRHAKVLRTSAEAKLGMGWGAYLSHDHGHINFSACYDLNYLWKQNYLRNTLDVEAIGTSAAFGDLQTQGLTFTARLDF